jgi:hypothetical protein
MLPISHLKYSSFDCFNYMFVLTKTRISNINIFDSKFQADDLVSFGQMCIRRTFSTLDYFAI